MPPGNRAVGSRGLARTQYAVHRTVHTHKHTQTHIIHTHTHTRALDDGLQGVKGLVGTLTHKVGQSWAKQLSAKYSQAAGPSLIHEVEPSKKVRGREGEGRGGDCSVPSQ